MALGGTLIRSRIRSSKFMTALIREYVPPGYFLIAADGREADVATLDVLSDTRQKVFQVGREAVACSMRGTTLFGLKREKSLDHVVFDFRRHVLGYLESHPEIGSSIRDYATEFSLAMQRSLTSAIENEPNLDIPSDPNGPALILSVYFDGFSGGGAESVGVAFHNTNGVIEAPDVCNPVPAAAWQIPEGIVKALAFSDKLNEFRDWVPRTVEPLSVPALNAVRSIAACSHPLAADLDWECLGIGPRIHMAEITSERGFQWVPGFDLDTFPFMSSLKP